MSFVSYYDILLLNMFFLRQLNSSLSNIKKDVCVQYNYFL